MSILVFGHSGRVGETLLAQAPDALRSASDITSATEVREELEAVKPSVIINLAAWTDVPGAELKRSEAFAVNAAGPCHLAAYADCPIVHVSTDCVFDGRKRDPYQPTDATHPINWYGETKLAGERCLTHVSQKPHVVIRTTGVYLRDRPNFLKVVLDKALAGEGMTVVADTVYTPTDARELAHAILVAADHVVEDPSASGIYHFAGGEAMSYWDFAALVQNAARIGAPLDPTTQAEREAIEGVRRPTNAALNADRFAEVFGYRHRPTSVCVRELVNPA